MTRALVVALFTLAGCGAPTVAQRAEAYSAGIAAGQAACLGLLADKEVERTPAAEQYCRLVLTQECSE